MKSAVETLGPTRAKLTVEVPFEELKPSLDAAYKKIAQQITVPGFRKGKVPATLIDRQVGRGAVLDEAINDALPQLYVQALQENDLQPLAQPEIDITRLEDNDTLEFTAEVDIRPEITLPSYDGLEVTVDDLAVTDEDVEEQVQSLRERFGTLVGVDRPAAEGDFVTIDLAAVVAGEDVDAVQGTSYQVGSGNMLEGLDEVLEGLSAGEETTYEGPLAAGDHAGETATITVKVTAVKERQLPDADDDFAQLASEFDTVAELREDLRGQAARIKTNNQAMEAREKLLQALTDATDFELPKKVIEAEVHNHLANENRLEDDEHRAEVTEEAGKALRVQILLDQLADDFEIEVEQSELLDYLLNASRQYNADPADFIEQVEKAGQIPSMVAEVARSKATAYALRRATVKDEAGNAVDLTPIIGSLEDEVASEEELDTEE